MPPRQTRAQMFIKNKKAENPLKTVNEGKNPSVSKRKNPWFPIIPSWRHGFFTVNHSVLAAHDLNNFRNLVATESLKEAPWMTTLLSVFLYNWLLDFIYLHFRKNVFLFVIGWGPPCVRLLLFDVFLIYFGLLCFKIVCHTIIADVWFCWSFCFKLQIM